ncbi:hypothetical protein D9M68_909130 [compost metagenome]
MTLPRNQPHQLSRGQSIGFGRGQVEQWSLAGKRHPAGTGLHRQLHTKTAIAGSAADLADEAHVETTGQTKNVRLFFVHAGDVFGSNMEAIGKRFSYALLLQHAHDD